MSKKDRETNRAARAAAIQREQAAKERNRKLLIGGVVVVVLAAVVALGVVLSGGKDDASSTADSGPTPKVAASGQAMVVGNNPKATKVVVYEDFLCPFCREFETSSRSFLHADARKGKVLVEYRPFHLLQDDYSTRALSAWAAVLQKGTPKQALKFHDLLYDNQPYENDPNKPSSSDLADLAKKAGVTDSSVLDAVKKSDSTFVKAADASADQAKVTGTPTIFVDGKQLQGSSVSDLVASLKQMLASQ